MERLIGIMQLWDYYCTLSSQQRTLCSPKITPQKKAKTCLFWLYRVTTACIWDVISTWKLHSPFTLAFPKGPMSHSLFQGNSTFDGSQMIGKGNVTCWSHVCVVYTIVTFACKAFFDFQSPPHKTTSFEKIYWSNFLCGFWSTQKLEEGKAKKNKCTESTTVFSKSEQ